MKNIIKINDQTIGADSKVYIIAEMSANHNQDFDQAVRLIKEAKLAGADAVKLQTYTPDTMTIDCEKEYFQIQAGTIWDGRNLYQLYKEAYTPWEWFPKLKNVAEEVGIDFFSTPFDGSSVDFLENLQVPAYKIASFELCDPTLLRKVASTGKPVILSTGMASLAEIDEAVKNIRGAGGKQLVLLKCTSSYPAEPSEMNLGTIKTMADVFRTPVGLSDHTTATTVPAVAVAMGACVIEKHMTLSRSIPGPDSAFSLEPAEFREMVKAVHAAKQSLGQRFYADSDMENSSRIFRRSLFVVRNMKSGEALTHENLRCIRPGHGLAPKYSEIVLGRRITRDVSRGTPLTWDLIGEQTDE